LREIEEREANLVAISVTMISHLSLAKELIAGIRAYSLIHSVKILFGGSPFNISSQLRQPMRADGYAPNPTEAILVARQLLTINGDFPNPLTPELLGTRIGI